MKKIIAIILITIITASLMACSSSPEMEPSKKETNVTAEDTEDSTDGTFKVGITCKDLTVEAYAVISGYLEERFAEAGYEYTLVSADGDPETMVNQIENFTAAGVNCIIIMEPVDGISEVKPVKEAMDAGIKVISYAFSVEGCYTTLACNNYDVGYQTGLAVYNWVAENKEDQKAEFALLVLDQSVEEAQKRRNGVIDALEDMGADGVTIVSEQTAQTAEEGTKMAENILQANQNLDGFICNSGSAAIGCNETIKVLNLLEKIHVFTCDSTADILTCIQNHDSNAIENTICVGSDRFMANKLFELVTNIKDGVECEEIYYADTEYIDSKNVDEFIEENDIEL